MRRAVPHLRRHGRACHRKSGLPDLRQIIARNSGRPEFRCHPRLWLRMVAKTWMPATSAGMTEKIQTSGAKETIMNRAALTEKILDIKREKGWKWKMICEKIGGFSETLIVGALLGQMKLTKPQAAKAAELFGLSKGEEALLNEVPMRGTGTPMPPTDPLIYRFYEMVMVNGPAWKQLIEEEFGDGIMSAIDFDMTIDRQPDPKGDRVKIGMT